MGYHPLKGMYVKETRPRDSQRSKVYKAEWMLRRAGAPGAERIESVHEIQVYLDKLTASAWWKRNFPHVKFRRRRYGEPDSVILVKDGRGRSSAGGCSYTQEISMPTWSRTKAVILHEVAHVVSPRGAWHDWRFCANFLKLVQHCLGKAEADALKLSFKVHKVRYKAPVQRAPMSEERKAELRERLVKARAAKTAKVEDPYGFPTAPRPASWEMDVVESLPSDGSFG